MKTLVIVDFQKDFCRPSGSLYVRGAEDAEDAIIKYINSNHNEIIDVVFTIDWHPANHCSFMNNGGTWPIHCVQYTEGAGISDNIMKACISNNVNVKIFIKGDSVSHEEYGAFDNIDIWEWAIGNQLSISVNNYKNSSPLIFDIDDISNNTANFVVCGIAGDYCVKETLKNMISFDKLNMNIEVLRDGIASLDNGTTIDNFIKENNLKVI